MLKRWECDNVMAIYIYRQHHRSLWVYQNRDWLTLSVSRNLTGEEYSSLLTIQSMWLKSNYGWATTIWGYFKEKSCAIGKNAFVCVTRVLHAEGDWIHHLHSLCQWQNITVISVFTLWISVKSWTFCFLFWYRVLIKFIRPPKFMLQLSWISIGDYQNNFFMFQ